MFYPKALVLTCLLQASVVLAAFNAPCQSDANCDAGESCLTVKNNNAVSHHCMKFPATYQDYTKAFGTKESSQGIEVGNLRKCSTPLAFNQCSAGGAQAKTPQQCCSHVFYVYFDSRESVFRFYCSTTDDCDSKAGCLGATDCIGLYEHCINGQCKVPVTGVDCGGEGQLPMKYGCCGGKTQDHVTKKCTDKKSGTCSGDSDCLGLYKGKAASCCREVCVQAAHCPQ